MADDGTIDGLTEDELIDDAELDTLVREAIAQVCFRLLQASLQVHVISLQTVA